MSSTQLRCLSFTQHLNQSGLDFVRTREVFGSLYPIESQSAIHFLRCLNWFKQSPHF